MRRGGFLLLSQCPSFASLTSIQFKKSSSFPLCTSPELPEGQRSKQQQINRSLKAHITGMHMDAQ